MKQQSAKEWRHGSSLHRTGRGCVRRGGDLWDVAANRLYWTDINRFLLHTYDPVAGTILTHMFDQPVVALSLTERKGRLLVALGSRLILFDPADGSREDLPPVLEDWPNLRFNDGRSDPLGAFRIGSMGNNVGPHGEGLPVTDGKGTLYRYRSGTALEVIETGIGIPNTLCWSPDHSHFYFGDTLKNEIRVYGYNTESGDIGPGPAFSPALSAAFRTGRQWTVKDISGTAGMAVAAWFVWPPTARLTG